MHKKYAHQYDKYLYSSRELDIANSNENLTSKKIITKNKNSENLNLRCVNSKLNSVVGITPLRMVMAH